MKKLLLLVCLLLLALPALAEQPEIASGDYVYRMLTDGTAEIVGYTGSAGEVSVPETLDGCTVTRIGRGAFAKNDAITALNVPGCVTFIDKEAFYKCVNLRDLTLNEGIKVIEWNAFSGCEELQQLVLPEGLEELGSFAFASCAALTRAELPASLVVPGNNPFAYCDALTEIAVAEGNPVLHVIDGVLFADAPDPAYVPPQAEAGEKLPPAPMLRKLLCYPGGLTAESYTTPAGVQIIGDRAVTNKYLLGFIMTDGVTTLEFHPFYSCDSLRRIEIPASVTSMIESLYSYCENCTVYVEAGSYAEDWCRENDVQYYHYEPLE